MDRRAIRTLLLFIVALSWSCAAHRTAPDASASPAEHLTAIDAELKALHPVLAGFPPLVSSDRERRVVESKWKETEAELESLERMAPDDAGIEWRLGVLYRYGHNLDIPGAGERCVSHLKRAIELRPDYTDAYLELGIFYTDSEMSWAPLGEANLKKAIQLSGSVPLPRAWRALSFAFYYQGKFSDSVAAAECYLTLNPQDEDMKTMKEIAAKWVHR